MTRGVVLGWEMKGFCGSVCGSVAGAVDLPRGRRPARAVGVLHGTAVARDDPATIFDRIGTYICNCEWRGVDYHT